jgi:aspartate beta-hydroxylase
VLRDAVTRAPQQFVAWLFLGAALERSGRADDAVRACFRAVSLAQKAGRWRSQQSTAPWLVAKVRHAIEYVRERRRGLIDQVLSPLRARAGSADWTRVERCVATYLGEAPLELADPRQVPKALYFPGLPATPYLAPERFPWMRRLEAAAGAIRTELEALLGDREAFRPFLGHAAGDQIGRYLKGEGSEAPAWDAFFFYRHGVRNDDAARRCPVTAACLESLPLLRIREHAPEICFSLLTPGTHILPHHGDTNTRVVVHLPLIVPRDCAIRVGGEEHAWREGRCVAFDDTFEHEAWNRSGRRHRRGHGRPGPRARFRRLKRRDLCCAAPKEFERTPQFICA